MFDVGHAQRILESVWRSHFHIPPPAYWLAAIVGVTALVLQLPPSTALWAFVILLAAQGIFRWRWHRRRSVGMVVARFSTVKGREPLAGRVQELVMTRLLDKLPEDLHPLMHPVPAVVGTADRSFASTLLRRLQCALLVHGRIEEHADGDMAVFARSAQPPDDTVIHLDWHTRDRTPTRARWSHLFERLTPTTRVEITEYPLEFATELEAIIRGFIGQVFLYAGVPNQAEPFLRAAITIAPNSTSHQVDKLRTSLAKCLAEQDRADEAINLLRPRAEGVDPSPDLLRTLAFLFHPGGGPEDEAASNEAIALLRRAAEYETDPALDMTLYNLATRLTDRSEEEEFEAEGLFQRLHDSSPYYRGTWYIKRHLGAIAYHHAQQAVSEGNLTAATQHFRVAASFYSKAIRGRPRLRFFEQRGLRSYWVHRHPPSPILVANAVDAHRGAGHSVRGWWLERKFQRMRKRFIRTAEKALDRSNWERAYAYADWAVVGRQDSGEAVAYLVKSVAAHQLERDEIASEAWGRAKACDPLMLVLRTALTQRFNLPRGVPGSEPTEDSEVLALLAEWGAIELQPGPQGERDDAAP